MYYKIDILKKGKLLLICSYLISNINYKKKIISYSY